MQIRIILNYNLLLNDDNNDSNIVWMVDDNEGGRKGDKSMVG